MYYVDIGNLYTWKIENLETVQVPNNYSAGCSLHGDVATQGILVGAHKRCGTTRNVLQNLVSWAIDIRGQTARCVRARGARLSGAMAADVENLGGVAQLMTINPTGAISN